MTTYEVRLVFSKEDLDLLKAILDDNIEKDRQVISAAVYIPLMGFEIEKIIKLKLQVSILTVLQNFRSDKTPK
ncbi:hypothetical protein H4219_003657 [Mycoemilia scoparia]|uniref:Uncharacterized protein n=1 Tax=Mycoemilia scoparia TaxID=417184 RepID=A0A9W8DSB8_9FUNG|nr:hypothetical protein H4219_003657 [Mycoemilia scoparia]